MSIRSYKAIYEKFAELFPELTKSINKWKGVRFADRHILLFMKDGTSIHFYYGGERFWFLSCAEDGA